MYHIFFIHSSVDRHLDCFHVLAIVNSVSWTLECICLFLIMFFSRYMSSSGIARSQHSFIFSLLRNLHIVLHSDCCCSVTELGLTLCDSADCSTPDFSVLYSGLSQSLLRLMSVQSMMPSNHLILCSLLHLPSIFPSIRVFSNEVALCIRWSKY